MKTNGFGFVGTLLTVLLWLVSAGAMAANPIVAENLKVGTSTWRLSNPADDIESQIKGYADRLSVSGGETIRFHVSVNPSQQYSIGIYRMGYYQGLGGREIFTRTDIDGTRQSPCPLDGSIGQITCAWSSQVSLFIPMNWVTGIYLAKLTNAQGYDHHIPFVVKHSGQTPSLLYQQPVTTYHAYNNYPDDGVFGKSTYEYNSYGANTLVGEKRAVRVSFDRPLENTGSYLYFLYEHELVMFLEERGYNVGYITDVDTHSNPDILRGVEGFISAGHDEYWTGRMRDTVEAARDAGTHLAFFGANAAFWQVRLKAAADGRSNRIMEVYKDFAADPEQTLADKTLTFRQIGRPEQQLVGVQYVDYLGSQEVGSFIATNTNHWIYEDTGITEGFAIPGIIGGEVDKLFAEYKAPASTQYTKIGRSPVQGETQGLVVAETVVYRALSGAWVFSSGTLLWHKGLNGPEARSGELRQMTRNLLNRFVSVPPIDPPRLTVSVADVNEDDGNLVVQFSLSEASSTPIFFEVATEDGTAQQGQDYTGRYQRVYISPGVTSRSWIVPIIDDATVESTETVSIRLFRIQGADAPITTFTPNIYDNDAPSVPELSVTNTVVSEADGSVSFELSLSQTTDKVVSVGFSTTTGGTATPGQDYYGASTIVSIAAGRVSASVPIVVVDDSIVESAETIRVQIFRAQNATILNRYAQATIISDD